MGDDGADSDDDRGDLDGDGDGDEGEDNDDGDDEMDGGDEERSNESRCFLLLTPPLSSFPILTSLVM